MHWKDSTTSNAYYEKSNRPTFTLTAALGRAILTGAMVAIQTNGWTRVRSVSKSNAHTLSSALNEQITIHFVTTLARAGASSRLAAVIRRTSGIPCTTTISEWNNQPYRTMYNILDALNKARNSLPE